MRYQRFLRERYQLIQRYVGLIGMICGWVLLLPLLALPAYPEEGSLVGGFLVPGGMALLGGNWLWWRSRPWPTAPLTLKEGAVIVVLGWGVAIALSTVPYLTVQGLPFTQACFEATSGWTTTGLSVIDVTQAPHLILLLRSLTQFFGGAGFAIIAVSAIASSTGVGVTAAEGRGERLVPNVRHSAKWVLAIYTGYSVIGLIALRLAGMGWFDALNHALTALSTGGFSTRVDSIGSWQQPSIAWVIMALMLTGSVNFLTIFLFLKGHFRPVWRNSELRLQAILFLLGSLILLFGVTHELYAPWGQAVRVALFETLTALSTTGFATVAYGSWSGLGWWLLICLMGVGGATGSTAGGVKVYRVMVLLKSWAWEIRRRQLPHTAVSEPSLWQGDRLQFLSPQDISQVNLLITTYLLTLILGTGILTAYGYSLQASLFEMTSSLSTVGLSAGVTGPDAPNGVLWVEITGMVLGRLEFFTVMTGSWQLLRDLRLLF